WRPGGGPPNRGSQGTGALSSVQGKYGYGGPGGADRARERKKISGGYADGHKQLRRRPAGFASQHPRSKADLQETWDSTLRRRLPLRGERVFHQVARARIRQQDSA